MTPQGKHQFPEILHTFLLFLLHQFPPHSSVLATGAPAQASKDDNASPGGPTGRSKIN